MPALRLGIPEPLGFPVPPAVIQSHPVRPVRLLLRLFRLFPESQLSPEDQLLLVGRLLLERLSPRLILVRHWLRPIPAVLSPLGLPRLLALLSVRWFPVLLERLLLLSVRWFPVLLERLLLQSFPVLLEPPRLLFDLDYLVVHLLLVVQLFLVVQLPLVGQLFLEDQVLPERL